MQKGKIFFQASKAFQEAYNHVPRALMPIMSVIDTRLSHWLFDRAACHHSTFVCPLRTGQNRLHISSIDRHSHPLELLDKPGVLSEYLLEHPTPHCIHEHSRTGSSETLRHSFFIFITSQYNWGYPAAIKNVRNYLFNE